MLLFMVLWVWWRRMLPPNEPKLSDRHPTATLECNGRVESPERVAEAQAGCRFAPAQC
jgi:hypothetical protein